MIKFMRPQCVQGLFRMYALYTVVFSLSYWFNVRMCIAQDSLFTALTDTLDDSSLKLRKGQAKDKFKKHAKDIVNPWQATDKETTKSLSALDEMMAMDENEEQEEQEEG